MKEQSEQGLAQEAFNNMVKQLKHELPPDTILLGTTTLRRMIGAVYDENDPLHSRNYFVECGNAGIRLKNNPAAGNEVVYVYYHKLKLRSKKLRLHLEKSIRKPYKVYESGDLRCEILKQTGLDIYRQHFEKAV